MEAKELKFFFKTGVENVLADQLSSYGFKWRHGSLKFQRSKDDFVQSILFFLTPSKYQDDKSIVHISIMIRLDSNEITKVATSLKGVNNKFDAIDTVLNVNAGLISGSKAIEWRPTSIEDMNILIEKEIKPLIIEKIIPFLNDRSTMNNVLDDFENHNTYFFSNSNDVVALLAIAMYTMQHNTERAKKIASKYLLPDEVYRERYKNLLIKLNS